MGRFRSARVPRFGAWLVGFRAIARFVCASLLAIGAGGCSERSEPAPPAVVAAPAAQRVYPVRDALAPGEQLPELNCAGWINGDPPRFDNAANGGLVVVDVVGYWCPFTTALAPRLKSLHQKYENANVRFVTVSCDDEGAVRSFATRHDLNWVHGFGARLSTITELGVYWPFPHKVDAKPTLYLVAADGRVIWCDGHARMKHEAPQQLAGRLESEIDQRLNPAADVHATLPDPAGTNAGA